jgi:uncharacterized membrane protein YjdF
MFIRLKGLEGPKILYLVFVGIGILELAASILTVIFATEPHIVDAGISNIFLSLLALLLLSLPWLIEIRFKVDIPNYVEIMILIFVFSAIVIGNIHGLVESLPGYDKLMHVISGITIAIIAFEIVNIASKSSQTTSVLTPGGIALFAFTFAMTLLVLWEFYEFFIDTIAYNFDADTLRNMQRYQWDNNRALFPQDNGLVDTMLDLLVGGAGAAVVSVTGWRMLHHQGKKVRTEKK